MSGCGTLLPVLLLAIANEANTSGQDFTPKSRIRAAAHSPSPTAVPP
jgi:hypothetical protein